MSFNTTRKATKQTTYEGGRAYKSSAKLDLYLLAVTSLMSGDAFYEKADDRLARFRALVGDVISSGGGRFVAGLAAYAREQMNLRTMPALLATELFLNGEPKWGLWTSKRVWTRGDEHLEALAYLDVVGSKRPKSFLRAVASRLCGMNEFTFIKYSAKRKTYTQRDAVKLSHPAPKAPWQSALFKCVVHGWDALDEKERMRLPKITETHSGATLIWEQEISAKGSTTETWSGAIDKMGYMALLRNLRNFVEKGVPDAQLRKVSEILSNPIRVAKSRQLPFRFVSAMRALPTNTPQNLIDAVSRAADCAVANVPEFDGDTLVTIDTSGSMNWEQVSGRSTIRPVDVAAQLGAILANRGGCDLWMFATDAARVKAPSGTPVLATAGAIVSAVGLCGHGTNVGHGIDAGLRPGIRRTIVLTDMQSHDIGQTPKVIAWLHEDPAHRLYVVDLAGYGKPCFESSHPQVSIVGGFSERVFEWIAATEKANPLGEIEAYAEESSNAA